MSYPPPPPGGPDEPTGDSSPTPANPYGQPPYGQPSGGPPPYGQPSGQPSGQPYGQPYGQPGGHGTYEAPKQTDGVSIAAFVLSLTFCLSLVGAILGFIGLGRTKDGQRKGRWAAISAIVIGLLFTVVGAVLVVFVGIFTASLVTVDDAEVGTCIDVDESDNEITMTEADCSEAHDAQIVYTGEAGEDASRLESDTGTLVCDENVDEEITELVASGDYTLSGLVEDPADVSADDRLVCYLERTDGEKISEKLG